MEDARKAFPVDGEGEVGGGGEEVELDGDAVVGEQRIPWLRLGWAPPGVRFGWEERRPAPLALPHVDPCSALSSGCRVQGPGSRVQGSRSRVRRLGFRVHGSGSRALPHVDPCAALVPGLAVYEPFKTTGYEPFETTGHELFETTDYEPFETPGYEPFEKEAGSYPVGGCVCLGCGV